MTSTAHPSPTPPRPWLDRALSLVPVPFLLAVAGGILVSALGLIGTAYPDAQFGATVNSDAAALYLGQPLYQDPEDGYSGIFYTPLLPFVVSLLDHVALWAGWPLLLTLLATLGPLTVASVLAHRARGRAPADRLLAVLEAAGVGALAWVLASCVQLNGIFGGNGLHDQVAWMPALIGLALVPAAASGSRGALLAVVVLLSAAFWTKQNTLAASAAATVWMVAAALLGAVRWRRALGLAAALLGLNAAVLGALNLVTGGWAATFNVLVPSRHPLGDLGDVGFPTNLPRFLNEDFLPATALGLAFAAAVWLAVLSARRAEARASRAPDALPGRARLLRHALRPATLAVPLLLTVLGALLYRRSGALNLYFLTAPSERGSRLLDSVVVPVAMLAILFAASLALAVLARLTRAEHLRRGARGLGAWLGTASHRDRAASVLVVSIVVGLPLAFYFRQKVGGDDNYYTGMAWAIAFLGAVGYRHARARARAAPIAAAAVGALFVAMLVVSPSRQTDAKANALNVPSLSRVTDGGEHPEHEEWLTVFFPAQGLVPLRGAWSELSEDLVSYAGTHLVYHKDFGDLNVRSQGRVWPQYQIFAGNLAGGLTPGYLVDAWLGRRFDAVTYPFEAGDNNELFTSGAGRWEENYLWKLNEVLRARYRPSGEVPGDLWERRPGPEAAPWMRDCFGPFEIAGAAFRINRGGGFWCRPGGRGTVLTLRGTPAPYSDVRSERPVREIAGVLKARVRPGRGFFEVALEPVDGERLRLRGEPGRGRRMVLTALGGERRTGGVTVQSGRGGAVELELSSPPGRRRPGELGLSGSGGRTGRVRVAVPALTGEAVLRLGGTRASGAAFDLRRLRLR